MGLPVAFYNGVRLWYSAKYLREAPASSSEVRKAGLSRSRGLIGPRSPNFHSTLTVATTLPSIDGDVSGSKAALSGYSRQSTRTIYLYKTFAHLKNQSVRFGDVVWVDDEAYVLSITGGPYTGLTSIAVTGGGWTPAAGDLALWRNPADGAGFVTPVTSYGGGSIGAHLKSYTLERNLTTGLPNTEDRTVTSAWKVYKVAYYYERSTPILAEDPPPEGRAEDKYAMDLQWQFVTESDIIYPSGLTVDLT